MKALTLHQPWASLIALGIKTIETRSWSTTHRGSIAIHAAKRHPKIGDMRTVVDNPSAWDRWRDAGLAPSQIDVHPGPLGAVVATARLVDCIPMVESTAARPGLPPLLVVRPTTLEFWAHGAIGVPTLDVTHQRPYGDFAPGRWAWLLDDIEPLDEPVPARGHQGLWNWEQP